MKTFWKRLVFMTMLAALALAGSAFAATGRLVSQRTYSFPNPQGGWSGEFTLTRTTTVTSLIEIQDYMGINNNSAINSSLQFFISDVGTGKTTKQTVPKEKQSLQIYEQSAVLPAGTYEISCYSTSTLKFRVRFSLFISGGINAKDTVNVMVTDSKTVNVPASDGGPAIPLSSAYSDNSSVATVSILSNSTAGVKISIKGVSVGSTYVRLAGVDGSTEDIRVNVSKFVPPPAITYNSLSMKAGQKVKNSVSNAASVKWRSSSSRVAKVSSKGKITAVGYGKCTITATAKSPSGKKYKLTCKVKVARTLPDFYGYIKGIKANGKEVSIKIKNVSKVPLIITNKTAVAFVKETGAKACKMKLKTKSKSKNYIITIKPGKSKTIRFKTVKAKLTPDKTLYEVRFHFTQDQAKYYGLADVLKEDSRYRSTKKKKFIVSYTMD